MGPLSFSLLRILGDGKLHTIDFLAQSLKVSQSLITNTIDDIKRNGINVSTTPNACYQWPNPINWLDDNKILSYLNQANFPFHLIVLDAIDSTNRFLLNQVITAPQILQKNPVIITELQTHGRGRLGRRWYSGLGDSLTFSLLWRFDRPVQQLSGLSLAIGVAIIRALKQYGIAGFTLKWPNDVLFRFCKLAGILIELSNDNDKRTGSFVVIGIGLNIQLSSFAKENIDQAFVDLFSITGRPINRNKLLAILLSELATVLNDFNHLGFGYFRNEWIHYHAYEGKSVFITQPDGLLVEGFVDGVEYDGSITLTLETGKKRTYTSGELCLRKGK